VLKPGKDGMPTFSQMLAFLVASILFIQVRRNPACCSRWGGPPRCGDVKRSGRLSGTAYVSWCRLASCRLAWPDRPGLTATLTATGTAR